MYMYAHPGKKLNFMGNEIGQLREWDEKREQDWLLLDYPIHSGFARFMKELNRLYLKHPAFWEKDYEHKGFRWIDCHQEASCVYVFERTAEKERILALFNFSEQEQSYDLKPEKNCRLKELFNSDLDIYGGKQNRNQAAVFTAEKGESISLTLPPYSGIYYFLEGPEHPV